MFTIAFWKDAGERAISTFAQIVVTLLGGDALGIIDVSSMNFPEILLTAFVGAVISILKAMAAGRKNGSPSIGNQAMPVEKLGG